MENEVRLLKSPTKYSLQLKTMNYSNYANLPIFYLKQFSRRVTSDNLALP